MPKIKYVGLKKDGEGAFSDRTGIRWMPGSSHDIADPALAQRMLQHPDVFALDDGKPAAAPKPAATPVKPPVGAGSELPAWAVKGIELGLTDDQLEAIAQAGGPQTEAGGKLWTDLSGVEWDEPAGTPAPAAAKKTAAKTSTTKAAAKKTGAKSAKK